MSWHDPSRHAESEEDRNLREELSELLGMPAFGFFEARPTPKMVALAEDLRREALRRRRTARHRPVWMLMAAALPLALTLSGMGFWGVMQKKRADALAETVQKHETRLLEIANKTAAEAKRQEVQPPALVSNVPTVAQNAPMPVRAKYHPGELVIEVKPATSFVPPLTQTVKQRGED